MKHFNTPVPGLVALLVAATMLPAATTPYSGSPIAFPGDLEAEDFDLGGEGVAYHDTDAVNQGGAYRTSGVDIVAISGGHGIGYIASGEWWIYTIDVAAAGQYDLSIRYAAGTGGAAIDLELDGASLVDGVGLAWTGSYSTYATRDLIGVELPAGEHQLKVRTVSAGFNFDRIAVTSHQSESAPYHGSPLALPGTLEAEDFDTGPESVAYHDTDGVNQGGQYRDTGVDIVAANGGHAIGYIASGEWWLYTIDIASAGQYDLAISYAAGTGGAMVDLELDGAVLADNVGLPWTGSYSSYATRDLVGIDLPAGEHQLKVRTVSAGFNFDSITVSTHQSESTPYYGTPLALPGTLEAEDFDNGPESVAYHDTDGVNQGGQYRSTGVDIVAANGGHTIGFIANGEWWLYTIDVATAGQYDLAISYAAGTGGAMVDLELDGAVLADDVGLPWTGSYSSYATRDLVGIDLPAGEHQLLVRTVSAGFNFDKVTVSTHQSESAPFYGDPLALPGTIQAEDFDTGPESVAYHDTDGVNQGGQYRSTGVDIIAANGGHAIGYIADGEWWLYTVDIADAGLYDLTIDYAAGTGGAAIALELDGSDLAGDIGLAWTGSYSTYATHQVTAVALPAGEHQLTVRTVSSGFNLDALTVATHQSEADPYGGTPVLLPGIVQAENYDVGPDGVAFHDSDGVNQGGAYRSDGVDIQYDSTAESHVISHIQAGEWLGYTVDVSETGGYDLHLRVAVGSFAQARLEIDGVDVTGTLDLQYTGGYNSWHTYTIPALYLTMGRHQIRLVTEDAGYNFDYLEFTTRTPGFQVPRFLRHSLSNMGYTEYLPPDYFANDSDVQPMLVFLGGAGETGDGNEDLISDDHGVTRWGPPKHLRDDRINDTFRNRWPGIVVAPQAPRRYYDPDFMDQFIEFMTVRYRVDEDRIYFTGLCMGGRGSIDYARAYPHRVAGVVPNTVAPTAPPPPNELSDMVEVPVWYFTAFLDPSNPWQTTAWVNTHADSLAMTSVPDVLIGYPFSEAPDYDDSGNIVAGTGEPDDHDRTTWLEFDGSTWAWTPWILGEDSDPSAVRLPPLDTHNLFERKLIYTLYDEKRHVSWPKIYQYHDKPWEWLYAQSKVGGEG